MRYRAVALLAALVLSAACTGRGIVVSRARLTMGTLLTAKAWGSDSARLERAVDQAFDSVDRLDSLLSVYRDDSEISRVNRAAGTGRFERVSAPFAVVLESALAVAQASGGAFDPTLRDWRGVTFDGARREVRLARGLHLDFGGIAKGYALDRAALALAGAADSAEFDFGGQLLFAAGRVTGASGKGRAVGIADPRDAERLIAVVGVPPGQVSVSTSSQAERPGHIVDPRSGKPASRARSVTVVAATGVAADAWSTAFFVLGCDRAVRRRVPSLSVICVDDAVRWTDDLEGRVALATDSAGRPPGPGPGPAPGRGAEWPGSTNRSRAPGN